MKQSDARPDTDLYLIESIEHTYDDTIVWWGPSHVGYTINVDKAGRYSHDEACAIIRIANYKDQINERMWSEHLVMEGKAGYLCRTVTKL